LNNYTAEQAPKGVRVGFFTTRRTLGKLSRLPLMPFKINLSLFYLLSSFYGSKNFFTQTLALLHYPVIFKE
jgi:hypothetical protein